MTHQNIESHLTFLKSNYQLDQLDYLKNKSLTIQQGQSLVMGRYKGIGQDGELLLLTEDALRKVHSGSVVAIEG